MTRNRFGHVTGDTGDAPVIHGRPDLQNHDFGITQAKKFPPYVFSTFGSSALVHKVAKVTIRWWEVADRGHKLVRVNQPRMTATAVCGQIFYLRAERNRTCQIPNPDAMLCGRCHGEPAPFGKDGHARKAGIARRTAHVKLGCVVKGYGSAVPS